MSDPNAWHTAKLIKKQQETDTLTTFIFECPTLGTHLSGQHYDIRLTAQDGYSSQRSYSSANPASFSQNIIELGIQRIEGGEVSPFLHDFSQIGDSFELKGPIGRFFVWTKEVKGPVFLIAGGSGVVPLMSILREINLTSDKTPILLLYSVQQKKDIAYHQELNTLASKNPNFQVIYTLTQQSSTNWPGFTRRIDQEMIEQITTNSPVHQSTSNPNIYICGPEGLVESTANILVSIGYNPLTIKTERFGPTG